MPTKDFTSQYKTHDDHGKQVDLFVAEFDAQISVNSVKPASRDEYIKSANNLLIRQQRYCVWELLDLLMFERLNAGVGDACFKRQPNGKWTCDIINLSLSHSNYCVLAAANSMPVGADVEYFDRQRFDKRLAERILTEQEKQLYYKTDDNNKPEFVAKMWAQKESLFKLRGDGAFVPSHIDALVENVGSQFVSFGDNVYVVAVATETKTPAKIRVLSLHGDDFN